MSALLALQTALQQHVLDAADGVRDRIVAGPGIGIERRLQIYHHAYRARLVETLADTFGHTAAYLGEDWFGADAQAYIETHPSTRASLRWYGTDFPTWLQQRHPQDGDIGELAALDWALRRAFDGPDAPVLTLADLGALPPEAWATLGFALQPTAERLTLHFNTLAIWQALDGDSTPPTAAPLAAPGALLVWRRDLQPHFRTLGPVEALALTQLAAGASFAATCAALAADFPAEDAATQAGALLRRWIDDGLLTSVTCWPAT